MKSSRTNTVFSEILPRALIGNFGVRGKESIAFGELKNIE
jgi:hypothetical protein